VNHAQFQYILKIMCRESVSHAFKEMYFDRFCRQHRDPDKLQQIIQTTMNLKGTTP